MRRFKTTDQYGFDGLNGLRVYIERAWSFKGLCPDRIGHEFLDFPGGVFSDFTIRPDRMNDLKLSAVITEH